MNYHEITLEIIKTFGLKSKKIAEILGKSTSLVYNKMKKLQGHKFNQKDFETINKYLIDNIINLLK